MFQYLKTCISGCFQLVFTENYLLLCCVRHWENYLISKSYGARLSQACNKNKILTHCIDPQIHVLVIDSNRSLFLTQCSMQNNLIHNQFMKKDKMGIVGLCTRIESVQWLERLDRLFAFCPSEKYIISLTRTSVL